MVISRTGGRAAACKDHWRARAVGDGVLPIAVDEELGTGDLQRVPPLVRVEQAKGQTRPEELTQRLARPECGAREEAEAARGWRHEDLGWGWGQGQGYG